MVVATAGIQEIASRVTSPLQLPGRVADGADSATGPISLASRDVQRTDATAGAAAQLPTGVVEEVPTPLSPPEEVAAPIGTPEVAGPGDAGWEITTPTASTTRWARTGETQDGQPTHRLEYLDVDGTWKPGYGNLADTTLTTPWIDVPAGDGDLHVAHWSRLHVEPALDGGDVSWSADGQTWHPIGRIDGGGPDTPVSLRTMPLPEEPDGPRIRLRIQFLSDACGSTMDQATFQCAKASHWELERLGLVRTQREVPIREIGRRTRPTPANVRDEPQVVVAATGPGINPYHREFRDDTPRAYAHPSTYLDGYPEDAIALWLTLDAPSFADAVEADRDIWESLEPDRLYWIPGTKIVGAVAPGGNGDGWGCEYSPCIVSSDLCAPDRPFVTDPTAEGFEEGPWDILECGDVDWPSLYADHNVRLHDDRATGLASLAAGRTIGGCRDCLVVHVDGGLLGTHLSWLQEHTRWIDVQVHWHDLYSDLYSPSDLLVRRACEEIEAPGSCPSADRVAHAASQEHLVIANPGDGPKTVSATSQQLAGAPGVIAVTGHDRGHIARPMPGARVAADYCRLPVAAPWANEGVVEVGAGFAWSTMRAAGIYAQALLDARRLLGDLGTGLRRGARAVGPAGLVPAGPLADGRFTLDEWRTVIEATASPRPPTDPRGSACADGEAQNRTEEFLLGRTFPVSTGMPWDDVPTDAPAHLAIGYGAIDTLAARARAIAVLRGHADLPARPEVDEWFEVEHQLRVAAMEARTASEN